MCSEDTNEFDYASPVTNSPILYGPKYTVRCYARTILYDDYFHEDLTSVNHMHCTSNIRNMLSMLSYKECLNFLHNKNLILLNHTRHTVRIFVNIEPHEYKWMFCTSCRLP